MDLLASGPERPPRRLLPRLPRSTATVLTAALAVLVGGVASVPPLQADLRAAQAPPSITATTSGGSVIGGRLRVWLLLQGPASAPLAAVTPRLSGSVVRARAPEAFSRFGDAVVRLDVSPVCPDAVAGLAAPALQVQVGGAAEVLVPFEADGLLASTVQARCAGEAEDLVRRGPRVGPADSGAPGVLRTVVDLGAPGPEVLVVTSVTPGPGLSADPLTTLPLRIAPGRRSQLVVDLRAQACVPDPESPPFVLEYAAEGDVEPVVERSLVGRLEALRRSAC